MKLFVERGENGLTSCISNLFIEDYFFCFVLEDLVREVAGEDVSQWKVPHQTAIPRGTYEVKLTFSNRFQRITPQLMNVPGFEGIRIHPGNTDVDTEGCLLPGDRVSGESVLDSRKAYDRLYAKLESADSITIEIA